MGIFDKFKNLFTEEIEEEIKPIKKEVRHVDVTPPVTRVEREKIEEVEEKEEEKKEEKFVFFSDDDFKDLEKPKREEKKEVPVIDRKLPYRGATIKPVVDEKVPFKPSPIISPVYGVLDKNYSKDEVVSKRVMPTRSYRDKKISVDDVRNKAYGTIEDEIKDSLLGNFEYDKEPEPVVNDIDIFEELEKYDSLDRLEEKVNGPTDDDNIDTIFDELDNKKDQILDELDNKKDEILDELTTKKDDIIIDEEPIDDLDLDDEALELSRQLESQKRKLDEINDFIDDTKDDEIEELNNNEDDLNESELFDLIDSMYEKKDDE